MARNACSAICLELHEPLYGSATKVRGWLLLEQPGPWGKKPFLESRLNPGVGAALEARARELGLRPMLIRRHGRHHEPGNQRQCLLVYSGPGTPWIERSWFADPVELLDLDLNPVAGGARTGRGELAEPQYLVCTHSRHDACCAEFGRPLAEALHTVRHEQTWECTHLGGHRFAANLVCLPHGLFYGRVAPADGPQIVADYEAGRVQLEHLRGRSSLSSPAQVADWFVRERTGLLGLDAVAILDESPAADDSVRVTVAAGGTRWLATVRRVPTGIERPTSCKGDELSDPGTWTLAALTGEAVGVAG